MPLDVEARVIQNTRLSPDYNVITLAAPEIAAVTRPGQFVMVRPSHGSDPLLRRPFSVFEIIRTGGQVEGLSLLSKRIGVTTRLLFDAVYGDVISCLGPLGRPFEPVAPPAEAWMVAGGVGLAPFATLTEALTGARHEDNVVLRCANGSRTVLPGLVRVARRQRRAQHGRRLGRRTRSRHEPARAGTSARPLARS